jgi:cellulose synthase operon protein C
VELSAQERAFAAEVERYRAAARVSQEWVAQRVSLSRPKISEVCSGHFLPSYQVLAALVTALGMDRERAVELWRAAREGREARRQAERMARYRTPEGWTALPVLPAEVQSLLRAQIQAARELPYRLPGARRPSLATVYVRQELGGVAEESQLEQPRPEPVWDGREPLRLPVAPSMRLAVRPPSRTLREALDSDDHLLVTGGPGQGKSTLSLRLAADIATQWAARTGNSTAPLAEPVVPLRLTARELAARLELPFSQALADSVRCEYGALLRCDLGAHLLADRVAGCRWLLLVDGLDEVANSAERDRLVTVLSAWACDPPGSPYRVVLTTRPIGGAALAPLQRATAARYELQPFDEEALRRFAENWFAEEGEDTAHRFVRQVREAQLDELVRVPLLATIAAIIFQQPDQRPLPDNQYELYEAYLEFLRSARPVAPVPFEHLRTGLLEHLGRVRLETDTSLVVAARGWVTEHIAPEDRPPGWQDELTAFLAAVGPLVLRGEDLWFLHHSFAEHLAATAQARLLPEAFDPERDAFAHLLHAACQGVRGRHARAVLLHYTRLHPTEADRLVQWLHGGTPDQQLLAARLLARHVPASAEVVDAFLTTAKAWAMTTQYPGGEILRRVSRAAHHPGLAPWLAHLMRDETAPWQSRVKAATALATRLRRTPADEATAVLRAVVDDAAVPVAARLTAAESLAQCGAGEREAAKRGLRSLLADPSTEAVRRRGAAVVLAGLGPQARAHAVQALSESVDDPQTPTRDLVESAVGLAEIGAEFQERSAEVFLAVLHDRARTMVGRQEAAVGLAALGPHHLAEAVTALTDLATDRGLDHIDRTFAAQALAEIGPQYRAVAGSHLLDMLAEPAVEPNERRHCASFLSLLGTEFHPQAATHLREIIADRDVHATLTLWAARSLVELGPDFHAEAAQEFHRLADDPLVDGYGHASALGQLARLGPPHRVPAVDRLRAEVGDRDVPPDTRRWAARELVELGPEFHAEATTALLEIISGQPDPVVVSSAGGILARLGTRFHEPAAEALLEMLGSPAVDDYPDTMESGLATLEEGHRQRAADALADVLSDATRSDWSRACAARVLVGLGRQFHSIGMGGFLELLRGDVTPNLRLNLQVTAFVALGTGRRAEMADAVHALMSDPNAGPDRIWQSAQALIELGFGDIPEVVTALRTIIVDESADATARCRAAVTLAGLDPQRVSGAVATLRDIATSTPWPHEWRWMVLDLARLGDDPVPLARALLADQDADRALRETAASVLPQLRPDLIDEAIVELRRQAQDEYLGFWQRTNVVVRLATLDTSTRDDAIAFHRVLLDNEDERINVRCHAAYQLVQLDRTFWQTAVATLRRLSCNPRGTPADQQVTTTGLIRLKALRPGEADRCALAIAHHPAARPTERQEAIRTLSRPLRLDVQRSLLADHTAPVTVRVPEPGAAGERPLVAETEAAVRDVLTAIESSPAERVDTAAALAKLSPRLAPEAARALEDLSLGGGQAAFRALVELARLGGTWWHRVRDEAERAVADDSLSRRERHRAANVINEIDSDPSPTVLDFLRKMGSDKRASDLRRAEALLALSRADGPGALRALRDDERARPFIRGGAAVALLGYTIEDRAAAAQVLHQIATDATARPALRCNAAEDLAKLGIPGRDKAADALGSITVDDTLPVTARAAAARLLAKIRPSSLGKALTILQELTGTDNPLHRRQVLLAMGSLDTTEAVPPLRAMTRDRTLGPVVRLRCTEALAELRRDQRKRHRSWRAS